MGTQHLISLVLGVESHEMRVHTFVDLAIDLLEELFGKIFEFFALGKQWGKEESDFLLTELGSVLQQGFESKTNC